MRPKLIILFGLWYAFSASYSTCGQQPETPKKYALLIGVSKYQHAKMNQPALKYPEADATAVANTLKEAGYTVEIILGKEATQARVQTAVQALGNQGTDGGAVLIGMFGHGLEYNNLAYFCPYDTTMVNVDDSSGNSTSNLEPDPTKLVNLNSVLKRLEESGASNRILLADFCRNDPAGARGRAFGANLKSIAVKPGTVAMFACSKGQKAYEHDDWKHGAFTYAFLKHASNLAQQGRVTAGTLGDKMFETVNQIVAAKNGNRGAQTVYWTNSGRVDFCLDRPKTASQAITPIKSDGIDIQKSTWRGSLTSSINQVTEMNLSVFQMGDLIYGDVEYPSYTYRDRKTAFNGKASIFGRIQDGKYQWHTTGVVAKGLTSSPPVVGLNCNARTGSVSTSQQGDFQASGQHGAFKIERTSEDVQVEYVDQNPDFPANKSKWKGKIFATTGYQYEARLEITRVGPIVHGQLFMDTQIDKNGRTTSIGSTGLFFGKVTPAGITGDLYKEASRGRLSLTVPNHFELTFSKDQNKLEGPNKWQRTSGNVSMVLVEQQ